MNPESEHSSFERKPLRGFGWRYTGGQAIWMLGGAVSAYFIFQSKTPPFENWLMLIFAGSIAATIATEGWVLRNTHCPVCGERMTITNPSKKPGIACDFPCPKCNILWVTGLKEPD